MTVEDVVTKNQGERLTGYKLLSYKERFSNAIRAILRRILDAEPPLGSVPTEPL